MSQTTQTVCAWCGEASSRPTGIGSFCNSACRKQHQRHPGHTKDSWIAARRAERQHADAVFKARNRDRSFSFDDRYAGPESTAGVDVLPGVGPYDSLGS